MSWAMEKLRQVLQSIRLFLNSRLGLLFKILVSISLLVYFFSTIDFPKFLQILKQISTPFLLFIFILIIVRNYISAFRFQILCKIKKHVGLFTLGNHYFIASMFNMFLPTSIGGDGVRVLLLKREGVDQVDSLSLILIERFVGFFSFVLFAFTGLFFISLPIIISVIVIGITICYISLFVFVFFPSDRFRGWSKFSGKATEILEQLRTNRAHLLQVMLASLIFQLVSIYIRYMVALSFGIDIGFAPFLVFIPLINLISLLPISLGGMGLREFGFVLLFSQVGLTQEQALLVSLGTFMTLVTSAIIGALIFGYQRIVSDVSSFQ